MTRAARVAGLVLMVVLVAANMAGARDSRTLLAEHLADKAGWSRVLIATTTVDLVSFVAPRRSGQTLTVYIEGDGLAFVGRRAISSDPSPVDPVALRMAIKQPAGSVAYLARPCQFVLPDHARGCDAALWTSDRYSPAVLIAIGQALDSLKQSTGAKTLVLVGYSGGGALAALLAEQRHDVVGLVTVAGNLDLETWTTVNNLAPLAGSQDPAALADRIADLPQVHFTGGRDRVVGDAPVKSFLSRQGGRSVARLVQIDRFDHACCWARDWGALAQRAELAAIPGWTQEGWSSR